VIERFRTNASQTIVGVAWFYCNGSQSESATMKPRYIIGSILRQLLEQLRNLKTPEFGSFLEQRYAFGRAHVEHWLLQLFVDDILSIVLAFHQSILIIDGIDECPEPHAVQVCQLLTKLATGMKVLVASRMTRSIDAEFLNRKKLKITEKLTSIDITTHLTWNFEHDPKLRKITRELQEYIKTHLCLNSEGMYIPWDFAN
jgi:hypothetical protein